MKSSLLAAGFLVLFCAAGCATMAKGPAYLSSEPFAYPPGTGFSDMTGGVGFVGAWEIGGFSVAGAGYRIERGSLRYPGIASAGNRLVCKGDGRMHGLVRTLAAAFLRTEGKNQYLAVLIRPDGALTGGNQNSYFGIGLANDGRDELFFGKPGGNAMTEYVIEKRGGSNQNSSKVAAKRGETALLIVRREFEDGQEIYTLLVNPGPDEPATGPTLIFKDAEFPKLMIYSTGDFSLDEIRIADNYAAVAPKE